VNFQIEESSLIEFAKSVELTATKVLEGLHSSARGGDGLEFHSSLPYSEGEDARRIDWKRYAATDRVFVRRFEKEEKSSWKILIDRSPSMQYQGKSLIAAKFAASILFMSRLWGDSWELCPFEALSLEEAFSELSSERAGLMPEEFQRVSGEAGSRLLVFSDFFFDRSILERLSLLGKEEFHSFHFLQVLSSEETRFGFEEVFRFEDLESESKITLDGRLVRKRYLEELKSVQDELSRLGNSFFLEVDREPLEQKILEFFETL